VALCRLALLLLRRDRDRLASLLVKVLLETAATLCLLLVPVRLRRVLVARLLHLLGMVVQLAVLLTFLPGTAVSGAALSRSTLELVAPFPFAMARETAV
jgi:beta-lactamase regulating signal transducer with metallopeptidase domain